VGRRGARGTAALVGSGAVAVLLALLAAPRGSPAPAGPRAGSRPILAVSARSREVPGTPASFDWPQAGEAAVAVAGIGIVGASPRERRVPIASLTKMMTALVILADHPLRPGQSGPAVTITAADVENYDAEVLAGDSTVRVAAGEVLSEYQLLEALLMPSADNIADRLAIWDAGSIPAFVEKMNAMAARLGLDSTHYADASGVDPRSASSAMDQAFVAARLIADPLVRTIVRRRRAGFPVTGSIPNPNPALGIDGIIGIKGGYTSEARNCLVTAAFRSRHRVLVVSVALGQPSRAAPALIDEALLETATRKLELVELFAHGVALGALTDPRTGTREDVFAHGSARPATVWPGLVLAESLRAGSARPGEPYGARVGVLTLHAPWGPLDSLPVGLAPAPAPPATRAAGAAAALAAAALRGAGR
jgi:D-alanyl-D-alanine carboxypeptidase (penicillin-binding protein 5/6)